MMKHNVKKTKNSFKHKMPLAVNPILNILGTAGQSATIACYAKNKLSNKINRLSKVINNIITIKLSPRKI